MSNTPHHWVILDLGNNQDYKVLCGWSGGYLDGDSWKINSGIHKIVEEENCYRIYGISGSEYICNKNGEGLHFSFAYVYDDIVKHHPEVKTVLIESIKEIFI